MNNEVKASVEPRLNFFTTYVSVPQELIAEVESFKIDLLALAERVGTCAEFEEEFTACGLSDRFNLLVSKCTPVSAPVSAEYQELSEQIADEMKAERKANFGKALRDDLADSVKVELEEEGHAAFRGVMTELDIMDDYTRATNKLDIISSIFKRKRNK